MPPQQQQQPSSSSSITPQQQQQPLARTISTLSGFGPNSILNNHGVHLNGNAVVNIYPEQNSGMSGQGTPTGASNFPSQYGHGLNTYALHQPQQQQTETKPKVEVPNTLDIMEFFQDQRFLYDSVRVKILNELQKQPTVDTSLITKLVNLSFEQFEKDLQSTNNGGYIPNYQ